MSRIIELDFTRGIAVNLMILSHMGVFLFLTIKNLEKSDRPLKFLESTKSNKIFNSIGVFAHTLFLLLVGINMVTSYKNTEKKIQKQSGTREEVNREYVKKNIKRAIFIALIGLLMSILTKSIFGSWFIVFGIFQFIAVSIILSIPIQLNYNHVFVIVLIFALLLLNCINFSKQNSINLQSIITGSLSPKYKFLDFFPLLPYFIFVVIGILIGNLNFNLKFNEKVKNNVVIKEISGMGRWSIQLYFLHVLIIYGIMKIVIGKKNIKI
jgi:uncharacterized membrane protein